MRFEEVYELRSEKRLSVEQAAEMLGVHERTFRRWATRYEEKGADGLLDERLGKIAHNAAAVDEVMALCSLYEESYKGFRTAHFWDKYRENHQGRRSYDWVKKRLQEAGLAERAKKRGAHRRKRPRRPMKGMMLHQDGSQHQWIAGVHWDLIVTMDDADNEIYSAFFVDEEGTWSSFQGVREVIEKHGLFCSLYTDRGSHYWYTPSVGGKVDKLRPTQFGRALEQLGIEMLPAYSPEARGRSERMFGTLQGRLPLELKLEGIQEMQAANQFLKERFLPRFNERFCIQAQDSTVAFVPYSGTQNIDDILCLQEARIVNKDNTVHYRNKHLQIPADTIRYSYAKTRVKVHEYANGEFGLFHGPRCLGRYGSDGALLT